MKSLAAGFATTVMSLDEKKCLKSVIAQTDVATRLDKINTFKRQFGKLSDNATAARVQRGFAQLASWQDSLMGLPLVDQEMLFPKNILDAVSCPQPCSSCTDKHNSFFKGKETTKFKCLLPRKQRNSPPSTNPKLSFLKCDKPKRRTWKFWQYKTWCTVQHWVAEIYDQARVAAMISCGSHTMLSTLRTGKDMTPAMLRTCMLVEQRMAVTMKEVRDFKTYLGQEGDGIVSVEMQSLFGVFLSLSTAQGLAGARDASQPPPSGDQWLQLYKNSTFTLLPPALVDSVPCDPPITNRQIFLGAFAAVVAIGSASMLAVLASMPLVLLGAVFYILAGAVFVFDGIVGGIKKLQEMTRRRSRRRTVRRRRLYMPPMPEFRRRMPMPEFRRRMSHGGWFDQRDQEFLAEVEATSRDTVSAATATTGGEAVEVVAREAAGGPPSLMQEDLLEKQVLPSSFSLALRGTKAFQSMGTWFTTTFRKVAAKVYHKLRPKVPAKLCPRGLLFLNGGSPVCLSDMDKLEAKRYKCPGNESRSVVVSCEDEFDGLVVVRGEGC